MGLEVLELVELEVIPMISANGTLTIFCKSSLPALCSQLAPESNVVPLC